MKNGSLFHGGLFREGFRRLRTVGLILLVLFTLFDLHNPITYIDDSYYTGYRFDDLLELHPMLIFGPFVPVLLTLWSFSFQNSRRDSDFYHSLPVTKLGISTSFLLSTVVWNAIIIFGSTIAVSLPAVTHLPESGEFFEAFLLPVCGAFVGSLITTALTFLALTLTGNTVTALAVTAIFLFGPRLMLNFVLQSALERSYIYPMERLDLLFDSYPEGLLYAEYESVTAWVGGVIITVVALALGLWLCRRRQSETAGNASVTPAVQVIIRLTFTMICSLPAIMLVHGWFVDLHYYDSTYNLFISTVNLGSVVLLYLFVIVAHTLFELITTKSVKKMVRSFPWLGIVALLNAIVIAVACTITFRIRDFTPKAEEIESVSVRQLTTAYSYGYDHLNVDHLSTAYNNACHYYDYDELKLTDNEAREAVAKALSDTVDQQADVGTFWADVCIYTDSGAHERRIEMTEAQVTALLKAMHEQHPFDSYYLENYMIKHERIR